MKRADVETLLAKVDQAVADSSVVDAGWLMLTMLAGKQQMTDARWHVLHVYAGLRDAGADHAEAVKHTINAANRYRTVIET